MDELFITDEISPNMPKKCCLGNNTIFTYHENMEEEWSPPRPSFINQHTQEAINELGPASPSWFEEALNVSNPNKGYTTPIQSKQVSEPFDTSPPLFSPKESDRKVNRAVLLQTPILLDDFDPTSPGIFTTPCQARRLPKLRKNRPSGFTSDISLEAESPSLLRDTAVRKRHSTPTSLAQLAKSLGMDANTSQLSWTSSLATPPRCTAKLTSSEDEETSADEKLNFNIGPARALFSPQTPHSDETDTEMESLNYSMDPETHESPGCSQKPAEEESQGTEPFSVGRPPSQELLGREEQSISSSGGMEFSCRRPNPGSVETETNGSSSREGVSAHSDNSGRAYQQESEVFDANTVSETGLKTDCVVTDHLDQASELFDPDVVSGTRVMKANSAILEKVKFLEEVFGTDLKRDRSDILETAELCGNMVEVFDGVSGGHTQEQEKNKAEGKRCCDKRVPLGGAVSGSVADQPLADSPRSQDVLSLFFKTPPGGSTKRLPPKKKKRLSVAEIDARITKTHCGDDANLEQTRPLKNSISISSDSHSSPKSSISLPFSEQYSSILEEPVAINTESLDIVSLETLSVLEERIALDLKKRKPVSQNGVSMLPAAPNSNPCPCVSVAETKARSLADGTTKASQDSSGFNPVYVHTTPKLCTISVHTTPKLCTNPEQILDSSIVSPCDEFSQISPSTLQAVCALETEYQAKSVDAKSATISDNCDDTLRTVSETGFKTPNLGASSVSTGKPSDICSPDGVMFSQISPSTLEAIVNETDAASEQHSKTLCEQTLNPGSNFGEGLVKDVLIDVEKCDSRVPRKPQPTVEGQMKIHDSITINPNLSGVLDSKTKENLCVTPVRWRNLESPLAAKEAEGKELEGNGIKSKDFDENVFELRTVFDPKKSSETSSNPPAPVSVTLGNTSKNRSLLGRKRKRFSYPTSSQITETCPSKHFCFGNAEKSEDSVKVENGETRPEAGVNPDADESSTKLVKAAIMPKTVDLNMSSGRDNVDKGLNLDKSHILDKSCHLDEIHNLDKSYNATISHNLDKSLSSPSSHVRKVTQRRAGFTSFSSYQKTCSDNQTPCKTAPRKFDENQNVSYTSPSYYRAGAKTVTNYQCTQSPVGQNLEQNYKTRPISHNTFENELELSSPSVTCEAVHKSKHDRLVRLECGAVKPERLGRDSKPMALLQGNVKSEIPDKASDFTSAKIDSAETQDFGGFSTAGGKQLKVSDQAMKEAVKILDDLDERNQGKGTNTKSKDRLGSSGVESSEKQSPIEFGIFATAGGKELKASDSALKLASKVLDEVEGQVPVDESDAHEPRATTACVNPSSNDNFQGFSTGTGKPLKVSGKSLKRAAKLLDEVEVKEAIDSKCSFDKLVPGLGRAGLSLGTDTKLTVSPCAWEKAKSIFDDLDMDLKDDEMLMLDTKLTEEQDHGIAVELTKPKQEDKVEGFLFASGKNVNISDKQLSKVKNMFDDIRDVDIEEPLISESKAKEKFSGTRKTEKSDAKLEAGKFSGFSFASGKDVKISDKLLNKVKNLFDDIPVEDSVTVHGVVVKSEKQQTDVKQQLNEKQQTDEKQLKDEKKQTDEQQQDLDKELNVATTENMEDLHVEDNPMVRTANIKFNELHSDPMKFTGFSFASGKKVEIADKDLLRVKSVFAEIENEFDLKKLQVSQSECEGGSVSDVVKAENEVLPQQDGKCGEDLENDYQGDVLQLIVADDDELVTEEFEGNDGVDMAPDDFTDTQFVRDVDHAMDVDHIMDHTDTQFVRHVNHTMDDFTDTQFCAITETMDDCYSNVADLPHVPLVKLEEGKECEDKDEPGTSSVAELHTSQNQLGRTYHLGEQLGSSPRLTGPHFQDPQPDDSPESNACLCVNSSKILEADVTNQKAASIAVDDFQSDFQTASGYAVSISKTTMQAFQESFDSDSSIQNSGQSLKDEELDDLDYPVMNHDVNIEADNQNMVETSAMRPATADDYQNHGGQFETSASLEKPVEVDSNVVGSDVFAGFTTARGSKVKISGQALHTAKDKLSGCTTETLLVQTAKDKLSGCTTETLSVQTAKDKLSDCTTETLSVQTAKDILSDCTTDTLSVQTRGAATRDNDAVSHVALSAPKGGDQTSRDRAEFGGFMTARGSKVKTSEDVLQSARDQLADCSVGNLSAQTGGDVTGDHDSCGPSRFERGTGVIDDMHNVSHGAEFGGFMTARGSKVNISEKALQLAKDKLADCNTKTSSVQGGCDLTSGNESHKAEFGGFMTAGRPKVNISERALQLVNDILAEMETSSVQGGFDLTKGTESCKAEFGGFMTAGGSKVKLSEKALQLAKDKLSDCNTETSSAKEGRDLTRDNESHKAEFGGCFMTAGGSKVNVSEKALLSARVKLADCDTGNSTVIDAGIAGTDTLSGGSGFGGFMTARGSKVNVSEKALLSARDKLADCDTDNSLVPKASNLTTAVDSGGTGFGGFMTARGSNVNVSEKALLSDRDKLADCATDNSLVPKASNLTTAVDSGGTEFGGFMTARGSKVNVSEKALLSARDKLADNLMVPGAINDVVSDLDGKAGFGGFITAKVDISEQTLQKAREKLADIDEFCIIEGLKMTEDEPKTSRDVCSLKKTTDQAKSGITGMRLQSVAPEVLARKPVFVAASRSEQRGSKSLSSDMDRKPLRFLMHVPKLTSHHPSVAGDATEFLGAVPAADAVTGARDAVTSTPERTLHDRIHLAGRPRSSVVSAPFGDNKSGRWQQTSFKPHNLPTSKHPSSFITPTKNTTASASKSTPSPGPSSSFNTPYKKPQEGSFSTPVKATSEGSFTTPFKSTPKGKPEEKTGVASSPRPPPTCQVKRKSLDFAESESPKSKESFDEATKDVSDMTMAEASSQDRKNCAFSNEILESITSAWQEERMGQDFAIQKKKKLKIKAISGSLFEKKASATARPKMRDAVQGGTPGSFSRDKLHQLGVCDTTLTITAKTAASFTFNVLELYSEAVLCRHPHLLLGDGAKLVPNDNGKAGNAEFTRAFLAMPGVDPRLISDTWLNNQYRWIIWKLAAMEVAFPYHFGGRCLTPEQVMLRLKYRYDREVDHCQRSALKKIYERDDTPTKRMVLCVAGIVSLPENNPLGGQAVIELTDGWYGIKTLLDKPLTGLLRAGKMSVGQKLCISGSELTGSQDACSPLEAPPDLILKIFANSTRRSRWDCRLGFCDCPQPFPVPLNSLFPEGGLIGCVDVVVTRVYPTQYMEKLPDGSNVFRSARMEEKIAKLHERKKEVAMETLQAKLQRQFDDEEKSEKIKTSSKGMKRWKKNEIESLQTGYDIYEAMEQSSDPGIVQDYLSDHQMSLLAEYRRELMDERQARLRAEFQKAVVDSEEKASLTRQVVPLYKVKVAGTATSDMDRTLSTFLTVWRPSECTTQMLSEGKRLKIFNLSAAPGRGWQNKETSLTATRTTQYQPINADENFIDLIYEPREVSCLGSIHHAPLYGELDLAGMVVGVPPETQRLNGFETVLTCDLAGNFATIKFWGGLQNYGVEEILKPGVFVGVCNLSWRRDSMSGPIRCVYVSESTHFTTKPHEEHLRTALEKLRRDIENPKTMVEKMRQKADAITTSYADFSRATPTSNRQPKPSNGNTPQNSKLISEISGVNSSASKFVHSNVTPSSNRCKSPKVISMAVRTDVLSLKSSPKNETIGAKSKLHSALEDCLSPMGEDFEDVRLSQQRSLQRSKAKKLEMYEGVGGGSPLPQVVQIPTPVSNKLRRDFKAPTMTPVDQKIRSAVSKRKVDSVVKNLGSDFYEVSNDTDCDEGKTATLESLPSVALTPLVRTGLMTRARRVGLVSRRKSSVLPSSGVKVRHETDCIEKNDSFTTDSVVKTDSSASNICKSSIETNVLDEPDRKFGANSDDPKTCADSDHTKADTDSTNSSKNYQIRTLPKSVGSGDCFEILTEKDKEITDGADQNSSQIEIVSKVSTPCSQGSVSDLGTPVGEAGDSANVTESLQSQLGDCSTAGNKTKRKHSHSSTSDGGKRRQSSRLSRRR